LDKQEGIVYSEDGLIKGGTMESIVQAITDPKFSSQGCLNAFLLTYRSFATPIELLKILIKRFHIKPTRSDDPDFKAYFEDRKRKPIQLRVGNCIRRWVDVHWYDFEQDPALLNHLLQWIRGPLSRSKFGTLPQTLEKLVEKKKQGDARGLHFAASMPESLTPPTNNFLDFSPREVARQLALLEFEVYRRIHPTECMHQSWTKKDKRDTVSPNICRMIQRSNTVPMWVATQILAHTDGNVRMRSEMVTLFIQIAKECNKLNNFNAVMEILAGLSLSPIHRLAKTWEGVSKKDVSKMDDLNSLMTVTGNWALYRSTLKRRNPPCIPYFGMYLTDLTFIEDGHPDFLEGSGKYINFIKCRQMAVVIQDIQQYQQKCYSFHQVPIIYDYLNKLEHLDEDALYNLSLEAEPRQPKS